jgi:hypothetical protein
VLGFVAIFQRKSNISLGETIWLMSFAKTIVRSGPGPNSRVTSRQIDSGADFEPIQGMGRAKLLTKGVFC